MRIALLADIHGNFDALRAVLRDVRRVGADRIACLGDTVGYGPEPGASLDLISEWADVMVLGNHDQAALSEGNDRSFNPRARVSVERTRDLLKPRHLGVLERLNHRESLFGVALAHASFTPGRFEYLYDADAAARSFSGFAEEFGAVGHTHIPTVFTALEPVGIERAGAIAGANDLTRAIPLDGLPGVVDPDRVASARLEHESSLRLAEGARSIVNPGSVGQPRDRNPLASWGLLDLDHRTFSVQRVAYDIEEVNLKLQALGMPEFLGERLRIGA